uniref:Coiled-coil domain containing 170 n=1 Tax=Labrus bergylta TaxID=56723 RepID=A0A3Q3ELI0_9LABR
MWQHFNQVNFITNYQVDQSHERERLKMRIAVLEESVKSCEVECKSSRETVLRLVAELDRERRKTASSASALDSLKVELDGLVEGRRSVEMEKGTLMERVEASKRVVEAARRESHCLEKQVKEFERKLQLSQGETQRAGEKLQMFLEKVVGLLQGKSENVILPTEEDVLYTLDNLCNKSFPEMEARLCHFSEELSEQTEIQHSALQRAQLAEQQVQDLRERLQALETELLTADMQHDGLRHSKLHVKFLEQLSEMMKIDSIAVDLGFDMRLKLILSRAEQLVKQETTALVENKSLSYSLQRKLKAQKDQLDSKGLHIQLLRKKVSELEEEKRSRSALAVERDDAQLEARRLQKQLQRLQGELKASRQSKTELKAQLSHTNELKVEGRGVRTPMPFFFVQLVDFQMVVSKMLGVDDTNLALPNYEIIKLLETLLHSHHHHHLLHHHVNMPWHCPTHQRPHRPQILDLHHTSSLDLSASRSTFQDDAVPFQEA